MFIVSQDLTARFRVARKHVNRLEMKVIIGLRRVDLRKLLLCHGKNFKTFHYLNLKNTLQKQGFHILGRKLFYHCEEVKIYSISLYVNIGKEKCVGAKKFINFSDETDILEMT